MNPTTLIDLCVKCININIRFKHRLDLLGERRVLPRCLVDLCKSVYETCLLQKERLVYRQIRDSEHFNCWMRSVIADLHYEDRVEVSVCKYIIDEKFTRDVRYVWGPHVVRSVCVDCYSRFYSDDNDHPSVDITFVDVFSFMPMWYFEFCQVKYWCNDCLQPLFRFPKDADCPHDLVVQIVKNEGNEGYFERRNRSFSSFWQPSLPPSPSSSMRNSSSSSSRSSIASLNDQIHSPYVTDDEL